MEVASKKSSTASSVEAVFIKAFVLFYEGVHRRFDGSLYETFNRSYFQGGSDGTSWKLSFTEATFMEATFMSVWMGASIKFSMSFTRKQLPGFGCFRRICRSNFRTFGGSGPRSSFRGSSYGRFRGSRGYRTITLSPSLREESLSTERSTIHRTWPTPIEEVRGISQVHSGRDSGHVYRLSCGRTSD